jgi:hypothetical protein
MFVITQECKPATTQECTLLFHQNRISYSTTVKRAHLRLAVQGNSHRRKHFKSGVYCGSIESNFLRALHALDANRRIHADFTMRFFPKFCQLVRSIDKAASVIPCFRSGMSVINCRTTTEPFNSPPQN